MNKCNEKSGQGVNITSNVNKPCVISEIFFFFPQLHDWGGFKKEVTFKQKVEIGRFLKDGDMD